VSEETSPTTAEIGPHGVTLPAFARISAELAEGDRPTAVVLEAHGLDEARWNESTMYWMKRLGDDALEHGEHATLAHLYSEAFARAQSALRPLPPMAVEEYAAIVAEIQSTGSPALPLAQRALSSADYIRLSRHFAEKMAADPDAAKRFFDHLQTLQPTAEEVEV